MNKDMNKSVRPKMLKKNWHGNRVILCEAKGKNKSQAKTKSFETQPFPKALEYKNEITSCVIFVPSL